TVDSNLTIGKKLIVTDSVRLALLTASLPVFTTANKQLTTNAMTGTGSVMMSASPTTTGTLTGAAANFSGNVGVTGQLGVGGASTASAALYLRNTAGLMSGTSQRALWIQAIFGADATSQINGLATAFTGSSNGGTPYTTTNVNSISVGTYAAAT